jgi:Thymidylate synthase
MLTIRVRNVNEALNVGVLCLAESGVEQPSRYGLTREYPGPVTTQYDNPCERVLFNPERDANPFFHLFESLWILGGRNDVAYLTRFNKRMAEFSDNGKSFHAPYGFRLRAAFGFDQLNEAVEILTGDPESRRVVLQIWDAKQDLGAESKDIPCNDLIFVKIRDGKLNITVCNRSNDMIWGAYGTNIVQFSMVQEYLAAMLGCQVGTYHQVSDSFHVYLDNASTPLWESLVAQRYSPDPYTSENRKVSWYPLVSNPKTFNKELCAGLIRGFYNIDTDNPFFTLIAGPMEYAWVIWKEGRKQEAMDVLRGLSHWDWCRAGLEWMQRRMK